MATYKSSKLFSLEERKRQTGKATSEVDIFQWKSTLVEELRKNASFTDHLKSDATWKFPKVNTNRGFVGENAETKCKQVDDMLTKISSVAPSCLVRAISKRTTCLEDVLILVRDWAGIQTTGSRHLDYYRVKHSWKADSDETRQEFFYRLKDSMEDALITTAHNITEDGKAITEDEDMTPCVNSIVVMDWIDAIGGAPLVEHVHRVYAKDLESVTLGSLQSRISKNLDSLLHEIEEQKLAHANRVEYVQPSQYPPQKSPSQHYAGSGRGKFQARGRKQTSFVRKPIQQNAGYSSSGGSNQVPTQLWYCKLCRAKGDHTLAGCPNLSPADRAKIAKARQTSSRYNEEEESEPEEYEYVEDDDHTYDEEDDDVHGHQD